MVCMPVVQHNLSNEATVVISKEWWVRGGGGMYQGQCTVSIRGVVPLNI